MTVNNLFGTYLRQVANARMNNKKTSTIDAIKRAFISKNDQELFSKR